MKDIYFEQIDIRNILEEVLKLVYEAHSKTKIFEGEGFFIQEKSPNDMSVFLCSHQI